MSTVLAFSPTNATQPPWSGQVTLDGTAYVLGAYWNVYAQRWYVKLSTQEGTVIQMAPLIGSPNDFDIQLFPDLFSTSVVFRESSQQFEIGGSPSTTSAMDWADMIKASYIPSGPPYGPINTAIPGNAIPGYAIPGLA